MVIITLVWLRIIDGKLVASNNYVIINILEELNIVILAITMKYQFVSSIGVLIVQLSSLL